MGILEIMTILVIHWFADFVLQSHWMAINKSKKLEALLAHTGTYSVIWLIVMYMFTANIVIAFEFMAVTFIAHTITDFFTSRLNSYLWKKNDVHNFFVSVGFDQVLHYLQLFLTYKYLIQ